MAKPSDLNPLGYIINRQYDEHLRIKNKLIGERLAKARNLYRKDLFAHYGCVNAIEFSAEGELLVSGGDDRRVLLWSLPEAIYDKGAPISMQKTHNSNIFCVTFDSCNKRIFSGGNDDQVLIHDICSGNLITLIPHRKPVYGLNLNPQNDDVLATASEDGRLLLFDVRDSPTNQEAQILAKLHSGFHSVMFNPTNPRYLVSANSEEGISLWDCRKPKEEVIRYDSTSGKISGISACFDSSGNQVLALRRRLPPVIYDAQKENAVCQFYHPQYYNSCTMKTCCFAGDNDEYVLSGSDDFNLYIWKMPNKDDEWGTSHLVLKGHRSIVNQVRYNKRNNLIASSGVEKMIKLWSSVPIGTWRGSLLKEHNDLARMVYSHEDYISLVGHSGDRISHDYSDQSILEDAKMMAFFDSLIQREIETWDSNTDSLQTSDSDSDYQDNWSKLVTKIYKNGRPTGEEPKKHKFNKITQLISKKKNRLAKMAHSKSSSSIQKYQQKENDKKQKLKRKANKLNGLTKKPLKKKGSAEKSTSGRTCRYRTRQSIREENLEANTALDAPSTSTGITNSHNSIYRVIQDSDDEDVPNNSSSQSSNSAELSGTAQEENFVNILPTPLNGTHDMYLKVLDMGSASPPRRSSSSSRRSEQNPPNTCIESRLGNTNKVLDEDCPSTSNSTLYINEYVDNNYNTALVSESESDSDLEFNYQTPLKKRRTASNSDSGCATGPCSSSSVYSIRSLRNHQECSTNTTFHGDSSEEEYRYETFRKQIKKSRLNIRKRIGADSDSN